MTAVASSASEAGRIGTAASILITPIAITEVLCTSAPLEQDGRVCQKPFPYVRLSNRSDHDITLKNAKLALWATTDKPPQDACAMIADELCIRARSSCVIWHRTRENAALSAREFNQRYGTALAEGEQLFVTEQHRSGGSLFTCFTVCRNFSPFTSARAVLH